MTGEWYRLPVWHRYGSDQKVKWYSWWQASIFDFYLSIITIITLQPFKIPIINQITTRSWLGSSISHNDLHFKVTGSHPHFLFSDIIIELFKISHSQFTHWCIRTRPWMVSSISDADLYFMVMDNHLYFSFFLFFSW